LIVARHPGPVYETGTMTRTNDILSISAGLLLSPADVRLPLLILRLTRP
jgi:hypothetical protein